MPAQPGGLFMTSWKDSHREQNRQRDREFSRRLDVRGLCLTCGGPMGIGHRGDGTCRACYSKAKIERWEQIEAWWAEGLKLKEIAERLGVSMGYLASDIGRMRKAGRAMPHRYSVS